MTRGVQKALRVKRWIWLLRVVFGVTFLVAWALVVRVLWRLVYE